MGLAFEHHELRAAALENGKPDAMIRPIVVANDPKEGLHRQNDIAASFREQREKVTDTSYQSSLAFTPANRKIGSREDIAKTFVVLGQLVRSTFRWGRSVIHHRP